MPRKRSRPQHTPKSEKEPRIYLKDFKPIQRKFNYRSVESILQTCEELSEMVLDKRLHYAQASTVNGLIQSAIRVHQPPQPAVQMGPSDEQVARVITGFINSLPAQLKNGVMAYARQQVTTQ
jgi:hypothetical protein